jgi:hypothetical protein
MGLFGPFGTHAVPWEVIAVGRIHMRQARSGGRSVGIGRRLL